MPTALSNVSRYSPQSSAAAALASQEEIASTTEI